MNFFTKQFNKLKGEINAILGKLSASQKISIVLLALVVALLLILVMSTYTSSTDYVALSTISDPQDLRAIEAMLESNGIDYEVDTTGGNTVVRVPKKKQAQARWLALENGNIGTSRDNLEWLFKPASITELPSRQRQKVLESTRRDLEDTLRWSRNVRNVRVVIQKGPLPIYSTSNNNNDSALVSLRLAPGVDKLSSREARTVRLAVNGAFSIPSKNVQITDDRGNNYPFVASVLEMTEEQSNIQAKILGEIEKIYSHIFLPSQFVVGVLVDVSHSRKRIDSEKYEPEPASGVTKKITTNETSTRGQGLPPGVNSNVSAGGGLGSAPRSPETPEKESRDHTEQEYENRFSRTNTLEEVPAGEIKGVSVSLVMDEAAVIEIIKKKEEVRSVDGAAAPPDGTTPPTLADKIKSYILEQEEVIKNLLPLQTAKVKGSTVMFPKPELPPEVGMVSMTGSWMATYWKDVAMGMIAIFGILAALMLVRRTVPTTVEIPKLEDRILIDEDTKNANEALSLKKELDAVKRGHLDIFPAEDVDDEREGGDLATVREEVGDSVEMLNKLTREKPSMVAAVLKNWMHDAVDKDAK